MPRGGKRPNSGPKKGAVYRPTLEKQEHNRQVCARIAADFDEYYEAMKLKATGVTHLMARDKDGKWKEVTDPSIMLKCLNSGEQFYRLSARDPDARALINVLTASAASPRKRSR
jgi:hypothetical protein